MLISVSNPVDYPTEKNLQIKCKYCGYFFEHESVNGNLIKHKRLSCNKNYANNIDEELKKLFKNTFSFLIIILTNLFCYQEKVFILMNLWMMRKV